MEKEFLSRETKKDNGLPGLSHSERKKQRDFWLRQFEEEIPRLSLARKTKLSLHSGKRERLSFPVAREQKQRVRAFAQAHGMTEEAVLLSAFMILLQKYSAQECFAVGLPVPAESAQNTIALTGRPETSKSVECFLREISQALDEAYRNGDYPLEDLIAELNQKYNTRTDSLFDVVIAIQERGTFVPAESVATAGCDIAFFLADDAGSGYNLTMEYDGEGFDPSYIGSLAAAFNCLLEEIPRRYGEPIGSLDIISDDDRARILGPFNHNGKDFRTEAYYRTVTDRFEKQCVRTPDRTAVIYEEQRITYAGLNAAANRIARQLRRSGVKPESFVVIMAKSSAEMIAAIYGVLKAGGVYVPVDPNYPTDRISYILNDCRPVCIVTAHASVPFETGILTLDITGLSFREEDSPHPEAAARPDNAAYVIYTSGTTGNPKGVIIEHRSLSAYVDQFIRYFSVNEDTVYLQQTYFGFDASVEELFPALMAGGRIVILPRESGIDMGLMVSLIEKEKINMISCVPIVANEMNHMGVRFDGTLILGGSSMSYNNVDQLIRSGTAVYNTYGPTEATVCASYYRVTEACAQMRAIPIGRPIENARIYILSGDRLCGTGVPGELCIAGAGIAREYLHQPELTKQKFVANPFGEGRLYRSGDLARWLPDGNIDFMGRIDDQIKIRGFRVELGEIESVIRLDTSIRDAAVIARGDGADKALYAYVVSDTEVDIDSLRARLKNELPSYMLPAGIMQLDSLPLTHNGKLNKRALPEINASEGGDCTAPQNDLQQYVLGVWQKILSKPGIGIQSDFFSIGGNSLNMLTVISALKEAGFRVTVKDLQDHPTVEELCGEVLSRQEVAVSVDRSEEIVIEKYDNTINTVVTCYDDMPWEDYNCFFRPVSIICESFCRHAFDIATMCNSFYTVYNINGVFSPDYIYGDATIEEESFMKFFNGILAEKLGIRMEKVPLSTPEAMHAAIRQAIDDQCPVLVPINPAKLVYSMFYRLGFDIHYMIVKGYDTRRERYRILDNLQLDDGASTVYKDFFIDYATLYESAICFSDITQGLKDNCLFVFRPTGRKNRSRYTVREALHDHVQILSQMENGSIPFVYIEEDAVRTIYTIAAFRDGSDSVRADSDNPRIQMAFRMIGLTEDPATYRLTQENAAQMLYYVFGGIEEHINMKTAYYKSLNSLLKKCGIDGELQNAVTGCEAALSALWQHVKQYIFMLVNMEDVPAEEVEAAIAAAKKQESVFRNLLMECDRRVTATQPVGQEQLRAEAEAAGRGYFIDNINGAVIDFLGDEIHMELSPDELYSLWSDRDTAPKIGKRVDSDNWEVSASVSLHYAPDENSFQDGIVIYLDKNSKFLYGVLAGDDDTFLLELHCPELNADYRIFTRSCTPHDGQADIRVRKEADSIHFEYFDAVTSVWVCAKTVVYRSGVESVAILSRNWATGQHTADFRNVSFSW